jgi:hypothetical protein
VSLPKTSPRTKFIKGAGSRSTHRNNLTSITLVYLC